jgi:AraC family transcriptional regulator
LLQASDHSLAEVALMSGFGDQSHMTKVFTRYVGVSPGEWRRQYRD